MKKKEKAKESKIQEDDAAHSRGGLDDLQHEELSGHDDDDDDSSLETSSTDEDEDEGLGDGNMGRSRDNILDK